MRHRTLITSIALIALSACSEGSDVSSDMGAGVGPSDCAGNCATTEATRLNSENVETIIAQVVAEAAARDVAATIAVTDRVGNVLGVYRMGNAEPSITVRSGRTTADGSFVGGGLEEISVVPDTLAAIAKAITGAYLASEGNAFTTRTASQIVQEHFNPQEVDQPGGPLFGVQFSQLPCSDLNTQFSTGTGVGPQRSPLGLSADPGGLPLYKNGTPVGGIGVIADGLYSVDQSLFGFDDDIDEILAIAGSFGFAAPADRRGDRITVDGKTLRFTDVGFGDLITADPLNIDHTGLLNDAGAMVPVPGYFNGTAVSGTAFGFADSGIRADAGESFATEVDSIATDAFVLVDNSNQPRFAPKAGTDGLLSANEVKVLLEEALTIANRARAQIRRPLNSPARVSISVVDTNGDILGIIRTRDAPIFGIDVGLQKARTAAFFSNANAASDLLATPAAEYLGNGETSAIADYVTGVRDFFNDPTALTGTHAFADRSGGNLARPYYPDGIRGAPHGPLSKTIDEWSPFSTGLQLDLVNNAILKHVIFVLGGGSDTEPGSCTELPESPSGNNRLPNGIQIFPGSVPIYRGDQLIGGIGVSGDGIEQDDMISFLGLHNAGVKLGTINNAPPEIRADRLSAFGVNLRYIQCPQAPFIDSNEQDVCAGK